MAGQGYQQETFQLVEERLDKAEDYTQEAWTLVSEFMNQLQEPSLYEVDFNEVIFSKEPSSIANTFSYEEPPFQSDLYDTLSQALVTLMEEGATGLDAAVEEAIWQRARDRQQLINERTYSEALEFFAARGWKIPPGALAGRLTDALTEQTRADAQLNYEISIEQARLAQKNSEFARATAVDMIKGYFDYWNKYADRTLEAAKARISASIEILKAEIDKFKAKIDLILKNADVNMKMALEANALRLETLKAGASVAAQLTASALAGTSVGAHVQYQGGYNYSFQESTSQSTSEDHNYNYNYEM